MSSCRSSLRCKRTAAPSARNSAPPARLSPAAIPGSIRPSSSPPTLESPTLSFWYWPWTQSSVQYDWQEAQIRDVNGNELAQVFKTASNAPGVDLRELRPHALPGPDHPALLQRARGRRQHSDLHVSRRRGHRAARPITQRLITLAPCRVVDTRNLQRHLRRPAHQRRHHAQLSAAARRMRHSLFRHGLCPERHRRSAPPPQLPDHLAHRLDPARGLARSTPTTSAAKAERRCRAGRYQRRSQRLRHRHQRRHPRHHRILHHRQQLRAGILPAHALPRRRHARHQRPVRRPDPLAESAARLPCPRQHLRHSQHRRGVLHELHRRAEERPRARLSHRLACGTIACRRSPR